MSRRSKLVYLVSFNAIAASVLVALATLLLSSGDASRRTSACAAGDGPITSEGFIPVSNGFASIEAAEAFICHEVVYPRETPGWEMEQISASRSGPAAYVGRGLGFASVTLDYLLPGSSADFRIEVSPFRIDPVVYSIVDRVEIMGAGANLIRGLDDDHHILQWEADGYSFYVEARTATGFSLADLYAILNSIR